MLELYESSYYLFDSLTNQVAQRIQNQFALDRMMIFDCRFAYEHAFGAIPGAINVQSPQEVYERIMAIPKDIVGEFDFVFHCEFSTYRGPGM